MKHQQTRFYNSEQFSVHADSFHITLLDLGKSNGEESLRLFFDIYLPLFYMYVTF